MFCSHFNKGIVIILPLLNSDLISLQHLVWSQLSAALVALLCDWAWQAKCGLQVGMTCNWPQAGLNGHQAARWLGERGCEGRTHWLGVWMELGMECRAVILVSDHFKPLAVQLFVGPNKRIKALHYWSFVRGIHQWLMDSPSLIHITFGIVWSC